VSGPSMSLTALIGVQDTHVYNIPQNLRALREFRGWSQRYVAEQLGIHWTMIQKFESGDKTPNVSRLAQLAELFEVTADVLIHGQC
jgi:transcriptional regulator with XRE-family HTH domain